MFPELDEMSFYIQKYDNAWGEWIDVTDATTVWDREKVKIGVYNFRMDLNCVVDACFTTFALLFNNLM